MDRLPGGRREGIIMNRFNLSILLAVAVIMTGGTAAQSSPGPQATDSPLSISIAPLASTLKSGSPVEIAVTLTNTSSQRLALGSGVVIPYDIDIRDANGVLAPLTDRGREWKNRLEEEKKGVLPQMGSIVWLDPGESKKGKITVTNLYKMDSPGEYKIQIQRDIDRWSVAKSNVIIVMVTP
jgi:hypothetical protein